MKNLNKYKSLCFSILRNRNRPDILKDNQVCILKKKDTGEVVGDMMALILTIITCYCLIFVSIYTSQFTMTKNNISVAMRNAILQMEEIGYLDNQTKAQLQSRLTNIGVEGPSGSPLIIKGTTENDATRPKLYLTIQGEIKMNALTGNILDMSGSASNPWVTTKTVPVNMTQNSVAVGFAE